MRLTKSDKELLLTVLQSYAVTQQMKVWNEEAVEVVNILTDNFLRKEG